jgi:uncharacterized protein
MRSPRRHDGIHIACLSLNQNKEDTMRWQGRRESSNVVDRRGVRMAGLGGASLIVALVYFFFTGDPSMMIDQPSASIGASGGRGGQTAPVDDEQSRFVKVVLADTEDVWDSVLSQHGHAYEQPKLVLFSGGVKSACGNATASVGPFYCPADHQVYVDLDFFTELEQKLGAGGDFAQAYVIAHEVGHHVQNVLGLMHGANGGESSVALELQADCLAGIWAMRTEREKQVLEAGDVEEAMGAAAAVGDDRLQMQSQGYVVPDSFTHGSSAQRVAAFKRGMSRGELEDCVR